MTKQTTKRPIDVYFDQYEKLHQNPVNKRIHWICVPLIAFSTCGLIWAIPFPSLHFLGKYNAYINWFAFFMAFTVYYYYRLSPVISYAVLLVIFVFNAVIAGLEKMNTENGWPDLWLICLITFVIGWAVQFIGHRIEGKKPSFMTDIKSLLIGPAWLLHFLFKKFGINY